jgi:hypothetical protein
MENDQKQDFVRITNREIYDGLRDVQSEVKELKAQVNAVLGDSMDIRKEYGGRLRSLELKVYTLLSGVVTACGLLLKVGFL